jgi:hypothetical protein
MGPEEMGKPMQDHGMQAGIGGQDLERVPRSRIPLEDTLYIFSNSFEHDWFPA